MSAWSAWSAWWRGRRAATSSRPNGPASTETPSNNRCGSSSSRSYDQSTVARSVLWRSAALRRPPVNRRNRSSSRCATAARVRARSRASELERAASRPVGQRSPPRGALHGGIEVGSFRPDSVDQEHEGVGVTARPGVRHDGQWTEREQVFAGDEEGLPARRQERRRRLALQDGAHETADPVQDVFAVVQDDQRVEPAAPLGNGVRHGRVGRRPDADDGGHGSVHLRVEGDSTEIDQPAPVVERLGSGGGFDGQARLPIPPTPTMVTSRCAARASASWASSRWRPTKESAGLGRFDRGVRPSSPSSTVGAVVFGAATPSSTASDRCRGSRHGRYRPFEVAKVRTWIEADLGERVAGAAGRCGAHRPGGRTGTGRA